MKKGNSDKVYIFSLGFSDKESEIDIVNGLLGTICIECEGKYTFKSGDSCKERSFLVSGNNINISELELLLTTCEQESYLEIDGNCNTTIVYLDGTPSEWLGLMKPVPFTVAYKRPAYTKRLDNGEYYVTQRYGS